MICRVAESCFWMHRHLERVDNTARMLEVRLSYLLDAGADADRGWRPLLVVAGEEPRFLERYGAEAAEDGEGVQRYLTWEEGNPVAIRSSAWWARENARTIRDTISLEVWEALNAFWLWLGGGAGRRLYNASRRDFYVRVKEAAQTVRGVSEDTIPHDEAWEFMRLGMLLERANQTARLLDMRHHKVQAGADEGPEDLVQWLALLRSCSGTETFLKRGRPVVGPQVARFLIGDSTFPRSIRFCLTEARHTLTRLAVESDGGVARVSAPLLDGLLAHVTEPDEGKRIDEALHDELTLLVDTLAEVCLAVQRDFFAPQLPG